MAAALYVLRLRKARKNMKASIVYNKNNEPRIYLELENAKERRLLRSVDALKTIVVGGTNGLLTDISFEIVEREDEHGPRIL